MDGVNALPVPTGLVKAASLYHWMAEPLAVSCGTVPPTQIGAGLAATGAGALDSVTLTVAEVAEQPFSATVTE